MDIFEMLKHDHSQLTEQLRALEKSPETEREDQFDEVQTEIKLHFQAEERVFYSELAVTETLRERVTESREEHGLIGQLLEDMASMTSSDEQWQAKLTVLIELFSRHVKEEEQTLFDEAREAVDDELAAELAERFEEEKDNLRDGISA